MSAHVLGTEIHRGVEGVGRAPPGQALMGNPDTVMVAALWGEPTQVHGECIPIAGGCGLLLHHGRLPVGDPAHPRPWMAPAQAGGINRGELQERSFAEDQFGCVAFPGRRPRVRVLAWCLCPRV